MTLVGRWMIPKCLNLEQLIVRKKKDPPKYWTDSLLSSILKMFIPTDLRSSHLPTQCTLSKDLFYH